MTDASIKPRTITGNSKLFGSIWLFMGVADLAIGVAYLTGAEALSWLVPDELRGISPIVVAAVALPLSALLLYQASISLRRSTVTIDQTGITYLRAGRPRFQFAWTEVASVSNRVVEKGYAVGVAGQDNVYRLIREGHIGGAAAREVFEIIASDVIPAYPHITLVRR